jgi:hypothetical protein
MLITIRSPDIWFYLTGIEEHGVRIDLKPMNRHRIGINIGRER